MNSSSIQESSQFPWNQLDRKTLEERLSKENTPRTTLSFYAYTPLENLAELRDDLYKKLRSHNTLGRIYLAKEGVNAQISVPHENLSDLSKVLEQHFPNTLLNPALEQGRSFFKLMIKIRPHIVAHGHKEELHLSHKGAHLDAHEWHEAMDQPGTAVVDVRNTYEHEVGHFVGSLRMNTHTFRQQCHELPAFLKEHKDKKILLYCTGGIRCETASALLKKKGFKEVYQLKGGIINYKRQLKEGEESRFIGKNFVFDERLGERVTEDVLSRCYTCGAPCDDHYNCAWDGCHTLFLQCKKCQETYSGCCSQECQEKHALPKDKGRLVLKEGSLKKPPRFKSSLTKYSHPKPC